MEYNGYTALANAIIEKAVKEYRSAYATPQSRYALKRFFLSDWFSVLTEIDGRVLIFKLEEEIDKKKKGRYTSGGYKM